VAHLVKVLPDKMSLVIGSGGARSVLAGAGALLGIHLAGISDFHKILGDSGGAIIGAFLADGMHPVECTHLTFDTHFPSLFEKRANKFQVIRTYLLKDSLYRVFRPRMGLYNARRLREFIDARVFDWPEKFVTVAVSGSSQVLFEKAGVTIYHTDGSSYKLADEPPSVGFAVQASAAIPGVFDGVFYQDLILHDGALSIDGRTPIEPIARHFGVIPETIIAIDVGDDNTEGGLIRRVTHSLYWKVVCGWHCPIEGQYPVRSAGTVLIKPDPGSVPSLKFKLDREQKWRVVMSGFAAAVPALEKAGLITGTALDTAKEILHTHYDIRKSVAHSNGIVREIERLMVRHGLF